jgi:hypothetical protein
MRTIIESYFNSMVTFEQAAQARSTVAKNRQFAGARGDPPCKAILARNLAMAVKDLVTLVTPLCEGYAFELRPSR